MHEVSDDKQKKVKNDSIKEIAIDFPFDFSLIPQSTFDTGSRSLSLDVTI